MTNSEDSLSDNESLHDGDGDDNEYQGEDEDNPQNTTGVGDIDDVTLFNNFKELRRMVNCLSNNMRNQAGYGSRNAKRNGPRPVNRNISDAAGTNALSRCNFRDFREVIGSLSPHWRGVIIQRGFKDLLEFDGSTVPRNFIEWLGQKVDINCFDICVNGKLIPVTPSTINRALGLPIGGRDIGRCGEDGKSDFLQKFKFVQIPTIKTFRDMILDKKEMSDDNFFRCFMIVALSCFLCPNSSTKPSPKYFKPLLELDTILEWDWSRFVCQWLFKSINKYKSRKKSLGGCFYFLAVYYLDFLDFGHNFDVEPLIPRIRVWNGPQVKKYIAADRLGDNLFGKRPVKDFADTIYAARMDNEERVDPEERMDPEEEVVQLRHDLMRHIPEILKTGLDGICSRYQTHVAAGFSAPNHTPRHMLVDIFQFVSQNAREKMESLCHQGGNGGGGDSDDTRRGGNENESDSHGGAQSHNQGAAEASNVRHSSDFGAIQNKAGNHVISDANVDDGNCDNDPLPLNSNGALGNKDGSLGADHNSGLGCPNNNGGQDDEATEIVGSQGTFVGSAGGDQVSQATVLVSSQDNVSKDGASASRKRRRTNLSSPDSSNSVSSRTRRRMASRNMGMSPLSHSISASAAERTCEGSSMENLVCVEDANFDEAAKRHGNVESVKQNVSSGIGSHAASTVGRESSSRFNHSAHTTDPILTQPATKEKHHTQRNAPAWNSPSFPSWRIMDDEDDFGNYIPDPNDRRPFDSTDLPPMHNQRSKSNGGRNGSGPVAPKKGPPMPCVSNADFQDDFHMDSVPFANEGFFHNQSGQAHPLNIGAPYFRDKTPPPIAMISSTGEYIDLSQEAAKQNDDAVFVGERSFAQNMSNLSSSSGHIYNYSHSSMEGASGSSSAKMAFYRPRRLYVPSKYMSSPFVNERTKVLVSAQESDLYKVLLSVSVSPFSMTSIIDYNKVKVTFGALGSSLRPGGTVSTFVVKALCKKIFDKNHSKSTLKHYFFTKVTDYLVENYTSSAMHDVLEKIDIKCFKAANRAHYLPNAKLLYFLVYFKNHWCVIVVHIDERLFVVLDPCVHEYGPESVFHNSMKETFRKNFIAMWKLSGKVTMGFDQYKFVFAEVPQATNEHDHGICIMKYLEDWHPSVNMMLRFAQSDIPSLRVKYANEMVFYELNKAYDGIEILKTFDPQVHAKYYQVKV